MAKTLRAPVSALLSEEAGQRPLPASNRKYIVGKEDRAFLVFTVRVAALNLYAKYIDIY